MPKLSIIDPMYERIEDYSELIFISCKNCDSEEVKSDAFSIWDSGEQMEVLVGTFDYQVCEDCGTQGTGVGVAHVITDPVLYKVNVDVWFPFPGCKEPTSVLVYAVVQNKNYTQLAIRVTQLVRGFYSNENAVVDFKTAVASGLQSDETSEFQSCDKVKQAHKLVENIKEGMKCWMT